MSRILLAVMLVAGSAFGAGRAQMSDPEAQRAAARAAEKKADYAAALQHYENLFDSTKTDQAARSELRGKFLELRPKVPPNADPALAGVWKVHAFAFRSFDVKWTDKDGKQRHAKHRFRDDEIESIRTAMNAFADIVWKHSWGNLRIDWKLTVIDSALTSFPGWPDPGSCMPHFTNLNHGEADSIFVYAKSYRTDKDTDDQTDNAPWSLWAGTFGVLPETRGATYIGFNDPGPPSGILQLHEWLHAAQWALESHQAYPPGLMITSDCGGNCGVIGAKPCYAGPRPDPDPKVEWMPLYLHLMDAHATRRMWRELSVIRRPDNCWINQHCRNYLAIGPFAAAGKPDMGLAEAFIDETAPDPAASPTPPNTRWRPLSSAGRSIDLAAAFGDSADQVAYLLATVRSDRNQIAQVRLGTDDGCKLWHNGRLILFAPVERSAQPDANIVDIRLTRGINRFLLKVANRAGGWEAILRLTGPDADPLPGIEYLVPDAKPATPE